MDASAGHPETPEPRIKTSVEHALSVDLFEPAPSRSQFNRAARRPSNEVSVGYPKLWTYSDAGELLCLSRLSVRRLVEAGHIRTVRFGRAVRVRGDDIEKLIEAGGVHVDRLAR
jgi:excisionase family DNA binding protein